MLNDKIILVTGGTGSFGKQFIKSLVQNYKPRKIIIYSRDEMKQWYMAKEYKDNDKIRFFIGDVRDKDRLHRAFNEVDIVVHAAALKIVDTAEYNPFEYVKTNIIGAMNIIDVSIDQKIKKVIALSTDKASNPINLYGATKLASDKLFISGNNYAGSDDTKFSIVRYGNVMGSRGSVIPFFLKEANSGKLPITDERMTRFMIDLESANKFVIDSLKKMIGGEIFVKKLPSMKVIDIADAIDNKAKKIIVGVRPGEKIHEQMISSEDSEYTYEVDDSFIIIPNTIDKKKYDKILSNAKKVDSSFSYTSLNNDNWMTIPELKLWIKNNYDTLV